MTDTSSTSAATCGDMIAVRPEGRGGVILACTQPANHREKHRHTGTAEGYPLVENTALIPIAVEWD